MKLKIGTRKSKLALWQAEFIQGELHKLDVDSELLLIESFGDKEQDLPIHKLGDKGVFTKALDEALLSGDIDLAIHSLKDVPTVLHPDLDLVCVPARENPADVLVAPAANKENTDSTDQKRVVATGSIRRRAFWQNRFPEDQMTGLRGNVPTRIDKVDNHPWHGGIFALAGLLRLNLDERVTEILDWMIPAPSQGALGVLARKDTPHRELFERLQDDKIRLCVDIERAFMNELEAGCSSPVGGNARIDNNHLIFKGAVLSSNGRQRLDVKDQVLISEAKPELGRTWAKELKNKGALKLMEEPGRDE